MPRIITVEGSPVLVRVSDVDHSRPQRFRPKKRKKAYDYGIKRLNQRQRDTLTGIMKAGAVDSVTKRAAAEAAGYAPAYALQAADNVLKRREIVELLEKHGVTQDKIATIIAEGLEAMHPLTKDPKPDHHARHKFVQEANRIVGNYAPTRIKQETDGRIVHLHLTAEDAVAAEKYRKMRNLDAQA
jgi:hypothetical protein